MYHHGRIVNVNTITHAEQCLEPVTAHLLENPKELESLAQAWDQMSMASCVTPIQEHIRIASYSTSLLLIPGAGCPAFTSCKGVRLSYPEAHP